MFFFQFLKQVTSGSPAFCINKNELRLKIAKQYLIFIVAR